MNIGIFGSAFNPPSLGHADAFEQALDTFDEIWLVPSRAHATKGKITCINTRLKMIEAFLADLQSKDARFNKVRLVDAEDEITSNQGSVYTYQLLDHLASRHKDETFAFLCGEDNYDNFHEFKNADYIQSKWQLFKLLERTTIRSSVIRQRIADGEEVGTLTTKGVIKLITEKKLYNH